MAADVGVKVVIIVFISLLVSTTLISWFLLQMYGVSVAGIGLPTEQENYLSHQNFTSNEINRTTITTSMYGIWEHQPNVGRVLIQKNDWKKSYFLIENIQKDSAGIITNTYYINNSVKHDYIIVLRYTQMSDESEIIISNDGIHVPVYIGVDILSSSPLVIPYPNMNKIEDVIITTKYNDALRTCEINFNGNIYQLENLVSERNVLYPYGKYYGGIATNTLGFTIKDFYSGNKISLDADIDYLEQTMAMLAIMFRLVFYNVNKAYLPDIMNVLLIKTQTIALWVAILAVWKG